MVGRNRLCRGCGARIGVGSSTVEASGGLEIGCWSTDLDTDPNARHLVCVHLAAALHGSVPGLDYARVPHTGKCRFGVSVEAQSLAAVACAGSSSGRV